ncbi:ribosome small subunit-dependent GTPase A [Aquibacillus kalidii]|uniref:ribosome small subunit-dependent GTPase A n=1 Tax=Aquibacillus kalidii TaxID=2762597 RepID=UPI001F23C1AB|nr:ribosome small subunit-dependent GTPase A [Aquibacillus kalidii]
MNLKKLGWNDYFLALANGYIDDEDFTVARVSKEHKGLYEILNEDGQLFAEISGKMQHNSSERNDYPAVGDWVVIKKQQHENRAIIHNVLPRRSKFSRKVAGATTQEQIVAANIDTIFLVSALNSDLNIRRIERYLVMAWESGANPVIILTKSDLCYDVESKVLDVEHIAIGVPIHVVSAMNGSGITDILPYLKEGETIALLGSSGVGKSTLTNKLLGKELLKVQNIREADDKGRHTTTHRELVVLPTGGVLIDTPGMRELQLWSAEDSVDVSFEDITRFAELCKFRDCNHEHEPGCAVKQAIKNDELDQERLTSYHKLQKELEYLERKTDKLAQLKEREKWKKLAGDRTRVHRR